MPNNIDRPGPSGGSSPWKKQLPRFPKRVQGFYRTGGIKCRMDFPPHDPSRVSVRHQGKVNEPFPRYQVSDVANPYLVRTFHAVTFHQVRYWWRQARESVVTTRYFFIFTSKSWRWSKRKSQSLPTGKPLSFNILQSLYTPRRGKSRRSSSTMERT